MNDEPEVEVEVHLHFDHWEYIIRSAADFPDCCSIYYREESEKESKEMLSLGTIRSARAIAYAILKWCDENGHEEKGPMSIPMGTVVPFTPCPECLDKCTHLEPT